MSDFLAEMAVSSRRRFQEAQAVRPLAELIAAARGTASPKPLVLHRRFDLIAELKLRAPSVGKLASLGPEALLAQAQRYSRAGAAAISVLTEPSRFDGDLTHLSAVARAVPVPVMRKDFLVAPYQVWEARLAGASGVLLIARMLEQAQLAEMLAVARTAGLFTLIEVFGEEDLAKTCELELGREGPPVLVGVNTRDLRSLEVVEGRLARLVPLMPKGIPSVAESGMKGPADIEASAKLGYRLALVGSALMGAADPEALAAAMLAAGRTV